jgi:hypothetical protein
LRATLTSSPASPPGRVLVKEASGKLAHKLVKITKPILRIPMLAIHLQRGMYEQGFKPNFQTNMVPLLATNIAAAVNAPAQQAGDEQEEEEGAQLRSALLPCCLESHMPVLTHGFRHACCICIGLFGRGPARCVPCTANIREQQLCGGS